MVNDVFIQQIGYIKNEKVGLAYCFWRFSMIYILFGCENVRLMFLKLE